jgi:hypothetical protein
MKSISVILGLAFLLAGCGPNIKFTAADDNYVIKPKPSNSEIVLRMDKIDRPHQVIGIIEAEMGRDGSRPELNRLMINKAREVGADGLMLVDYDIDRTTYLERHHTVVGRGPWRTHVVRTRAHTSVNKTACAVAVIFK